MSVKTKPEAVSPSLVVELFSQVLLGNFATAQDAEDNSSSSMLNATRHLSLKERELLELGRQDNRTVTKLTVTLHYNSDVAEQMLEAPPDLFLHNIAILPTNYGYIKTRVPIKVWV